MRYRSFVPRLGLAYVRVLAGLQFVMFFGGQEFKPGLAETLYHVLARNFPRTHLVFVLRLRRAPEYVLRAESRGVIHKLHERLLGD